jgi:hypothetical protein
MNLNDAKDSISQAYFHLLNNDALFKNFQNKHALIRANLKSLDLSIEQKRELAREHYAFMDTLTLSPEYINSTQFRGFLGFYLRVNAFKF